MLTAEAIRHQPTEQLPLSLLVPEMAGQQLVEHRANRFIRFTGAVTVADQVQVEAMLREQTPENQTTSLMDSLHRAYWGDAEAVKMVAANVRTDMVERTIKAGHVIKVDILKDENGNLIQHGQSLESVHTNGLLFASETPAMRQRAEAEARNAFRIKSLHDQGVLKDYNFVVFSRYPDKNEMSDQEAQEVGFFKDTKSAAYQVTTETGEVIQTESAFVAGVKTPGADNHDAAAVVAIGEAFDVDYSGKSAAEIIDMPLIIHKSLMPNGVIDLVKMHDAIAGGFFGQDKPTQDYQAYLQTCLQREAAMEPAVQAVVERLISKAPQIHTPTQAIQWLDKLSEAKMVQHSIADHTINPLVFGEVAAPYIVQARLHTKQRDILGAQKALLKAQETAVSSSCPSALKKASKNINELPSELDELDLPDQDDSAESANEKIRCPKCRVYVKKSDAETQAKTLCCPSCKYEVDVCNNTVLNEGDTADQPEPPDAEVISLQQKHWDKLMASNPDS